MNKMVIVTETCVFNCDKTLDLLYDKINFCAARNGVRSDASQRDIKSVCTIAVLLHPGSGLSYPCAA